jgi:RNA polymerase sigma-70 factor, ECF subfamily
MRSLPENLSDDELIRLIRNGKEMAFTTLYRRHQGPIFRFALHMSGRIEIAEEVTQDVFLELAKAPQLYDPKRGNVQALLIGIARNRVRQRRDDPVSALVDILAAPDDPFDEFARSSDLRALHAAILSLPIRYREAVVLCDLEELDYQTAARFLGCATGTIRSRLSRARNLLAAKLGRRERCMI